MAVSAEEGRAEVEDGSSQEPPVVCEHATRCGGCPLIALPYREQLEAKHRRVLRAFARYPSLADLPVQAVAAAEPVVAYRTRAKLIVGAPGRAREPAPLGLFAKGGGHHVVDIPRCRVLAPALGRVSAWLRERMRMVQGTDSPMAPFEAGGAGALRAVDLREVEAGAARVLVTFVVQRDRADAVQLQKLAGEARTLMQACPEVVGVAANFHEGDAPQVLGGQTVPLAGALSAPDRMGRSTHLATFGSFVQAHRGQTERIHAILQTALSTTSPSTPRVLDLYGGSGSIALALAATGSHVTLVESFAPAAESARSAARAQGIDIEVECGDAGRMLRRMRERGDRFDAAVVNPPRRGVSPAARDGLVFLAPELVAYVSCDPDTLARDLDHLRRNGYAPISVQPIDMIPLTDEVETVVVLRRGGEPAPRVLLEDEEVLFVEKAAHEPTAPEASFPSSLLTRVRRLRGASEAVVVAGVDIDASGVVVLVRNRQHLAKWRAVLDSEKTSMTYLAAVRGVPRAKGVIGGIDRGDPRSAAVRTRYRRLAIAAGHAILRATCEPATGQMVRRHLAFVGHPVLGDDREGHGPSNRHFEEKAGLDRAFLHRDAVEFSHPDTAVRAKVVSRLPGDLRGVIERLGGAAREWLDRADP